MTLSALRARGGVTEPAGGPRAISPQSSSCVFPSSPLHYLILAAALGYLTLDSPAKACLRISVKIQRDFGFFAKVLMCHNLIKVLPSSKGYGANSLDASSVIMSHIPGATSLSALVYSYLGSLR